MPQAVKEELVLQLPHDIGAPSLSCKSRKCWQRFLGKGAPKANATKWVYEAGVRYRFAQRQAASGCNKVLCVAWDASRPARECDLLLAAYRPDKDVAWWLPLQARQMTSHTNKKDQQQGNEKT